MWIKCEKDKNGYNRDLLGEVAVMAAGEETVYVGLCVPVFVVAEGVAEKGWLICHDDCHDDEMSWSNGEERGGDIHAYSRYSRRSGKGLYFRQTNGHGG